MNSYPKQLYISLFITEVLSIFGLRMVQTSLYEVLGELLIFSSILGVSIYVGSLYAFNDSKKALEIQKIPLVVGLALFVPVMMITNLFTALLLLGFFMLAGFNITLNSRKNMAYVLGATFVIFLYAVSESRSSFFLFIAIAFIFAFMAVLIQEYYFSRTNKQQKIDEKYTGLGVGISLLVLVFASLLYLFIPRLDAINLGFLYAGGDKFYEDENLNSQAKFLKNDYTPPPPTEYPKSESKPNTSSYSLEAVNPTISNALLFYVRSSNPVYLRGSVYETYNNNQWEQNLYTKNLIKEKNRQFILIKDLIEKDAKRITVFHTKDAPKDKIIYTPPSPSVVEFPASVITRDAYSTIYSPKIIEEKSFYSSQVSQKKFQSRTIIDGKIYKKEPYLQIPKSTTPHLSSLAEEITANLTDDYEKAQALEKHLRTNYTYTLDTIFDNSSEDIVETFLFDKKYGHCKYFATSMTMMLRSLGIPARFVTGYVASTYNPLTGYYEVRPINHHAWVEAWIKPYGWLMFEPTPGYQIDPKTEDTTPAKMIERYLQELENIDLSQGNVYEIIRETIKTIRTTLEKGAELLYSNVLNIVALIFLGIILSFIWYKISPYIWSKFSILSLHYAQKNYEGNQRYSKMFDVMQEHLSHYKLHREEPMTIEEYANYLESKKLISKEEQVSIVKQMNLASYGDSSHFDKNVLFDNTLERLVRIKMDRKHPLVEYFLRRFIA
jgi:transglutaminase-like putative cysteine protease